jgi:hypothetical protein
MLAQIQPICAVRLNVLVIGSTCNGLPSKTAGRQGAAGSGRWPGSFSSPAAAPPENRLAGNHRETRMRNGRQERLPGGGRRRPACQMGGTSLSVDVPACGVPASGTEGYSMYLRAEYLLVRRGTEGTHQKRGPAPAGKCGSCDACHMRGSRSSCRPVGHGVASAGGGSSPQKLRKFLYKFCARRPTNEIARQC